ncbi:hypothetical protein [Burkholderia anthina]|uniref:hypothetical protein n=1 Tax=Burkholderia anthina TaxID=179879 RepID=UPI003132BA71
MDDWAEIDAAFGANRDPFDGEKLEEDLGKLFSMIVETIPDQDTGGSVASFDGRPDT